MDLQQVAPWIVFFVCTGMLWAVFTFFSGGKTRATERLDELRDPSARNGSKLVGDTSATMSVFEKAAPTLSKALQPKSELEQSSFRLKLANAGFNSPTAGQMFLASKVAGLVICMSIGAAIGLFNWGWDAKCGLACAIATGIGFYGPEVWLWMVRSGRMERVFLALPDALDLLVVCVEAGLGLDAAMRRVSEELGDTHPDVCHEFNMCNMQLQMGRIRREVLHDMGLRSGIDDMKALAATLIHADKLGTPLAQALRQQSDMMRVRRRQMAEERAQATSVKMIFPMVLFIFPGVFVVLVGPAAIMMMQNLFK
jgi:tight adherence protein C